MRGTLTIVPVANLQAFYAGTRHNPIDLTDLNRCFPGKPDGTVSERLACTLFHEFVLANDMVLSMHGWWHEAVVVPYVEYPEGSSPVARRSREAANAAGLEYLHPYNWLPGQLAAQAVLHGVPTLEPEVGGLGIVLVQREMESRRFQYARTFRRFAAGIFKAWGSIVR